MTLRSPLHALVALVTILLVRLTATATEKPNVLLICVDDLKPTLGCYGDPIAKTPNVDRLAARGMRFDRAYCNQAVCSPSRNALMTGLRPQTLGIYDLGTNFRKAAPEAVTLAQQFQRNDYRTEAMGKIFHVGHGNHEDAGSWSVPHWKPKAPTYASPENRQKETQARKEVRASGVAVAAWKLPRGEAYEAADVPDNAYADGAIADEAVQRLQAAKENQGQPFFMAVGFVRPHLPFCAPKKYWDLYDASAFKLADVRTPPEGAPEFAPQFGGELRQYAGIPKKGELPEELQRTLIHGYYAATSYMDAQLGRVLDALEETGLARNTIVVLWGDHGWHLGDHGMWCKHTNYEEAARIPVIVATSGLKAGGKTAALIETVDIYPTLCELAGVPVPQKLDGLSFAAVLKNPAASIRESVIHVYPRGPRLGRAIRTGRHRLVEWKNPGAPADTAVLELYDYQADPAETKNLAAEQPEIVAQLSAILDKHPEAKPQIRSKNDSKKPVTTKRRVDRETLFARKDKNTDGMLTRDEFLANQPDPEEAPKRFITFDVDKDGVLSRTEFVSSGKRTK